jgi:AraC-like DNA-binding protein
MVRLKPDRPRGVLNVRDPESRENLTRFWPSEDLAPFVEHYWIVRWSVVEPRTAETLPHPSVHLVLETGGSEVVGVLRGRFTRELVGDGRVVAIKFRPGGFRPFVDRPMAAFTDRRWPLGEVFPERARGLEDRVLSRSSDLGATAEFESFLRSFGPIADPSSGLAGRIAIHIAQDREIMRVDQVAAEFHLTIRQLQRLFREYVGVSPKWVIQRYRLIEAAERLATGDGTDLATVALDLGYADQPHFIRDFKRIVGRSPADYARRVTWCFENPDALRAGHRDPWRRCDRQAAERRRLTRKAISEITSMTPPAPANSRRPKVVLRLWSAAVSSG